MTLSMSFPAPAPAAPRPADPLLADVLAGLSARAPTLPCKLFYDERGSRLFDDVCASPEYPLARAESRLLAAHARAVAAHAGSRALLVELGAGSADKTRLLLDALSDPAGYWPVDISREQLARTTARITRDYPRLWVAPITADYEHAIPLPARPAGTARTLAFFPGSTIGNFQPAEALAFLRRMRTLVGRDGGFLTGVDLLKDAARHERAYNDAGGATAAFNRNVLAHLNWRFGAGFDLAAFEHRARFEPAASRIVMELVAVRPQTVMIAGRRFVFAPGDRIVTEHSYKFTTAGFEALLAAGGFVAVDRYIDADDGYAVYYARPTADRDGGFAPT